MPPKPEKAPKPDSPRSFSEKPRKEEPLIPIEPPKLRRGIKVGRIRRLYEARRVRVFRRERVKILGPDGRVQSIVVRPVATGETISRRLFRGFEDRKTHKILTPTEVTDYRRYLREKRDITLSRKYEVGHYQRLEKFPFLEKGLQVKDRSTGKNAVKYRDRITKREATQEELEAAFDVWYGKVKFGPRLVSAIDSLERHNPQTTRSKIETIMRQWLIKRKLARQRNPNARESDLPGWPTKELNDSGIESP